MHYIYNFAKMNKNMNKIKQKGNFVGNMFLQLAVNI